MDRRLLFPIAAVTAWAQQPSPEAAAAEAAVRARADEFFKLQVARKFREAEALVAEDTKDTYYNSNKFNIKNFTIQKVELLDDNTRAKVLIKAGVTVVLPAGGEPINVDVPQETLWKFENGQWFWHVEPTLATPFGVLKPGPEGAAQPPAESKVGKAPDIATLQNMVKIDRSAVVLTKDAPQQTITLTNGLPGPVDLAVGPETTVSFDVVVEKRHLEAGETSSIQFRATGEKPGVTSVGIVASPIGTVFNVQVTRK